MNERLYRSRRDRVIAGVAGGLAERLDADPSLVRIIWAILMPITGFLALGVYIVMAIVVPEEPEWGEWPQNAPPFEPPPQQPYPAPPFGAPAATTGLTGTPPAASAPDPTAPPLAPPAFVPIPPRPTVSRPVPPRMPRDRTRTPGVGGLVVGAMLVLLGIWLLLEQFYPSLNFDLVWPLFIVGAGVVLLVAAVGRGSAGSGMRS